MRRLLLVIACLWLANCTGAFASVLAGGGFESQLIALDTASTAGAPSVSTTTVHSGAASMRCNPTTTNAAAGSVGGIGGSNISQATLFCSFYFRYHTKPASNDDEIAGIDTSGNADKFTVRINSSGNLVGYDSTATLLATGSTVLAADTWYLVDMESGSSATVGAYEVRINGVSEFSGTGNTSATNGAFLWLGKHTNRNGNTCDFFYDDYVIDSAAYVGATSTIHLVPDSTGTFQTATIGAGSTHPGAVNETPPDDNTSYLVSDGTTSDAETENFGSTAGAGISGTIRCVTCKLRAERDGASNGNVKARIRSGSTNSDSGGSASGAGYGANGLFLATDPNGGGAWTTTSLDSVEAGFVENSANKTRVTVIYLAVTFTASANSNGGRGLTLTGVGFVPARFLRVDRKMEGILN